MSPVAFLRNRLANAGAPLTLVLVLLLVLVTQPGWSLAPSTSLIASAVRYVAAGGACMGKTPCYGSVQAAVDAASGGDLIKIAAGSYSDLHLRDGDTQVVYITKDVTLRGGYNAAEGFSDPPLPATNRTILDAQEQGRVVVIKSAGPTLEGLVITGGAGYYSGGGVKSHGGATTVAHCEIVDNSATGDGGGVWVNGGSISVRNCDISQNRASWGAGLRVINNANVSLVGNRISENIAQNDGGGVDIDCCGGSTPVVARNLILANQAGDAGGGVHVLSTNAHLVNNVIARNDAGRGAGVWLEGFPNYPVSATLTHNTFKGTSTGEGVGTGDDVDAVLVNNIITGFTTGISNTVPAGTTMNAQATLFYLNSTDRSSGVTSTGEVLGAPVFLDPSANDYHIHKSSAAIDQGQDAGIVEDFDGWHRPIGSAPDIGAYEWGLTTYLPLARKP